MARTKLVDGKRLPLTIQEEAKRDAEETAWAAGATARQTMRNQIHRDQKLMETNFIAIRQRDQIDNGDATDLNLTNYKLWLSYRQSLRNITKQPDPFNITWPTDPDGGSSAP